MEETKNTASISFLEGIKEPTVPEIRLTRSRDGRTGQAFFTFEEPEALSNNINAQPPALSLTNVLSVVPSLPKLLNLSSTVYTLYILILRLIH